jgi:hypothetical protein
MTSNRTSAIADDPTMDVGTEQSHPLAEAGQEAGESLGHVAQRAGNMGFQQADQAKQQAAQGLNQLASTVRRVSTDMQEDQPMIANVANTAADQTERIASFLRDTDAREIVRTVEDVARRQPLLFVGGGFLLGLAASRFLKAAGGGNQGTYGYGQGYGRGYGTTGYGTTGALGATDASYGTYGVGDGSTADGSTFDDTMSEGVRP